jgi:hypothetical protein
MRFVRMAFLVAVCVVVVSQAVGAQAVGAAPVAEEDWHTTVYPILAWVPIGMKIDVNVPPLDGDGGGSGEIVDSRLDGAFFGGVAASNGTWRVEGYGLWASFGGERPERPSLNVDLDLIY